MDVAAHKLESAAFLITLPAAPFWPWYPWPVTLMFRIPEA